MTIGGKGAWALEWALKKAASTFSRSSKTRAHGSPSFRSAKVCWKPVKRKAFFHPRAKLSVDHIPPGQNKHSLLFVGHAKSQIFFKGAYVLLQCTNQNRRIVYSDKSPTVSASLAFRFVLESGDVEWGKFGGLSLKYSWQLLGFWIISYSVLSKSDRSIRIYISIAILGMNWI